MILRVKSAEPENNSKMKTAIFEWLFMNFCSSFNKQTFLTKWTLSNIFYIRTKIKKRQNKKDNFFLEDGGISPNAPIQLRHWQLWPMINKGKSANK